MTHSRSLLLNGLSLLLRRLPAVLWTFVFSLGIAILFALRLHGQFSALLDHSLAAASLIHGFDVPTAANVMIRLGQNVPGGASFSFAGSALFLLIYFVLVPGVLFCYLSGERARLSTLLRQGLLHFWRFVRITIVSLLVFGIVLGPLSALNTQWGTFIGNHLVGRPGFLLTMLGALLLYLVASLIRLFFDLVEVYTVQLGLTLRPNGRPDRRVRRAFAPAWRGLRLHFVRLWGGFLLLSLLGLLGFALLGRTALHTLAQPRSWPLFLFSQLAVLLSMATRFWQRGAEVTLALDHPILLPSVSPSRTVVPRAVVSAPVTPLTPAPRPSDTPVVTSPLPVVPGADEVQPLTPPGDLPPEQVMPPFSTPPPAITEEPLDRPAPVHGIYDIDPFTPIPAAPNPLSTETEETFEPRPTRTPSEE